MNIYQINKLTKKNILFYQTENRMDILNYLLHEGCIDDAIIIYNIYKWKNITIIHKDFLKYLFDHKVKCNITLKTFKNICQKGDKELFFYGRHFMKKYICNNIIFDCLMSNNYDFVQFIFNYHKIARVTRNTFISCIKQQINIEIIEYLFNYIVIDIYFAKDILYYISKYKDYYKFSKRLFSLYPKLILKNEFNSFFYVALSYNNIQLCYDILSLRPNIIENMNSYYLVNIFVNLSYDSIYLIHLLKPDIFKNIDHNYFFMDLVCNPYFVSEKIVHYYIKYFKNQIKDDTYYKCFDLLCYHGRGHIVKIIFSCINDDLIDVEHYFLHGCLHNYSEIVELFLEYVNKDMIKNGFMISCKNGYLNIAKMLYNDNQSLLYEAMYNISYYDNNDCSYEKIQLIQWLYFKNDTIYPRELIYYLCKYGSLMWIMGDNTFYIDQKCINLLCLHGHFDLFYYIYNDSNLFKREYIYDAFYNACENKEGLFIAKWIYYHHYLNKSTIIRSFYNSQYVQTIRWLYYNEKKHIHLRANNNAYFKEQCISNNIPVINWLCALYDNYHYHMIDGIIYYYITLYKIKKEMIVNEDCSICYEQSNCKTLCNHYFCDTCIEKWYSKQNHCPMCRKSINEVFIQH